MAPELLRLPVLKQDLNEPGTYRYDELCITDRVILLLEWAVAAKDEMFARLALDLVKDPPDRYSVWQDSANLVTLIKQLRSEAGREIDVAAELADRIEAALIHLLDGNMWADDIETVIDSIEAQRDCFSEAVFEAITQAIVREVEEAEANAADVDSESTLNDHADALERLAPLAGVPTIRANEAVRAIRARVGQLVEQTEEADEPEFTGETSRPHDIFDDTALANLFAPLCRGPSAN